MARVPRLAALRRALGTRRAVVAGLAALLALLGILLGALRLGWHRPAHAASLAGQALAHTARLALGAGWPLLVAAAALALGVFLSDRRGRAALGRLWTAPPMAVVRWLFIATGLLAVLVVVIAVLPPRFTADRHFDKATDELKAQNDVRTTLLQALAGGVLALGAYFTYRQLRVTREGQITDRYTKAVDQLGHDELDVRLGGIYALERIARDSPPDRATIEEVLTAFVRGHAPWPVPPAPLSLQAITQRLVTLAQRRRSLPQRRTAKDKDTAMQDQQGRPDEEGAEPQGPTADVQAAMTVLSRRQHPPDGLRKLDLTKVDLRRAELARANLQGAVLFDANLQGGMLAGANLQGAELAGANLQGAELFDANLQDAKLDLANLQGVMLARANLQDAELARANLQDVMLARANLRHAGLAHAHLRHAKLFDANLQDAWLAGANLQGAELAGANLQGAELLSADLQGADLARANLRHATLHHADLPHAKLTRANLQGAVLFGANLQGAELTRANLQGAELAQAALHGAAADEATRWPDGWDKAKAKARGVRYSD